MSAVRWSVVGLALLFGFLWRASVLERQGWRFGSGGVRVKWWWRESGSWHGILTNNTDHPILDPHVEFTLECPVVYGGFCRGSKVTHAWGGIEVKAQPDQDGLATGYYIWNPSMRAYRPVLYPGCSSGVIVETSGPALAATPFGAGAAINSMRVVAVRGFEDGKVEGDELPSTFSISGL